MFSKYRKCIIALSFSVTLEGKSKLLRYIKENTDPTVRDKKIAYVSHLLK